MSQRRSYKRSLLENSPAIQEHEEMMDAMLSGESQQPVGEGTPAPESAPVPPVSPQVEYGTVSQQPTTTEPYKNVQCRIPLSLYMQLSQMKYTSGPRTSIGDIAARAIEEYVHAHAAQK